MMIFLFLTLGQSLWDHVPILTGLHTLWFEGILGLSDTTGLLVHCRNGHSSSFSMLVFTLSSCSAASISAIVELCTCKSASMHWLQGGTLNVSLSLSWTLSHSIKCYPDGWTLGLLVRFKWTPLSYRLRTRYGLQVDNKYICLASHRCIPRLWLQYESHSQWFHSHSTLSASSVLSISDIS